MVGKSAGQQVGELAHDPTLGAKTKTRRRWGTRLMAIGYWLLYCYHRSNGNRLE
jgi:hypothetical protein